MWSEPLTETSAKRVARVKLTLTEHTIDALEPAEKSWLAWDDELIGFGVRVQPTGVKSYIVNYRPGDGGRKAPNKRVVIGRHGKISSGRARRLARRMLDEVERGSDPAGGHDEAPGMPVLKQAMEDYMAANPGRTAGTNKMYRDELRLHLADWSARPLDTISRRTPPMRSGSCSPSRPWCRSTTALSRRSRARPSSSRRRWAITPPTSSSCNRARCATFRSRPGRRVPGRRARAAGRAARCRRACRGCGCSRAPGRAPCGSPTGCASRSSTPRAPSAGGAGWR